MEEPPPSPSRLLNLPPEIRHLIWVTHLTSTTLTSGKALIDGTHATPVTPAPNSLALLRTCRQIHQETQDIWLNLVLFDFTHMEFLLDKLAALPLPILRQIHRARVTARPLMLTPPGTMVDVYYRLGHAFKLVPGLQLKSLEVIASSVPPDSDEVIYDTISSLVKLGNGWRELRFFIPHSRVLAFKGESDFFDYDDFYRGYRRAPQPDSWTRMLRERDGQKVKSEVKIYRSKQASPARGAVYDPLRRESFKQDESQAPADGSFGSEEDAFLMSEQEAGKEMLIIAKRAPDVDTSEDISGQGTREYEDEGLDIRQWTSGMKWAEIKTVAHSFPGDDDDDSVDEDSYLVV
jgi:hypothetical protein